MAEKVKRPKTKQECFDMLDEILIQEDKDAIAQMEDTVDLHFGLGMWIRNNWIYPRTIKTNQALIRQLVDIDDDMPLFIHPDDYSSIILDAYQEYLKSKK